MHRFFNFLNKKTKSESKQETNSLVITIPIDKTSQEKINKYLQKNKLIKEGVKLAENKLIISIPMEEFISLAQKNEAYKNFFHFLKTNQLISQKEIVTFSPNIKVNLMKAMPENLNTVMSRWIYKFENENSFNFNVVKRLFDNDKKMALSSIFTAFNNKNRAQIAEDIAKSFGERKEEIYKTIFNFNFAQFFYDIQGGSYTENSLFELENYNSSNNLYSVIIDFYLKELTSFQAALLFPKKNNQQPFWLTGVEHEVTQEKPDTSPSSSKK